MGAVRGSCSVGEASACGAYEHVYLAVSLGGRGERMWCAQTRLFGGITWLCAETVRVFAYCSVASPSICVGATQVVLYLLLLAERFGADAASAGLLLYLNPQADPTPQGVRLIPHELAAMMQQRNEVARALRSAAAGQPLPPVLRSEYSCAKCFSLPVCTLSHAAHEGGSAETFGAPRAFSDAVGHLSPAHLAFFRDWDRALSLEQAADPRDATALWGVSGEDVERRGGGMAGLSLVGREEEGGGVVYRMERRGQGAGQLAIGEGVIVSEDADVRGHTRLVRTSAVVVSAACSILVGALLGAYILGCVARACSAVCFVRAWMHSRGVLPAAGALRPPGYDQSDSLRKRLRH